MELISPENHYCPGSRNPGEPSAKIRNADISGCNVNPLGYPQLVIFDIDGTIIDHENAARIALEKARTHVEELAALSHEELSHLWGKNFLILWKDVISGKSSIEANRTQRFLNIIEGIGYGQLPEVAERAASIYGNSYESNISAISGADEVMGNIKELGIPIALLTNNLALNQKMKLEKAGLNGLYDFMLTSEETGLFKPDREIFNALLKKFSCLPGRALMVGNSFEEDVAGAYASGIRAVWFNRFRYPKPDTDIKYMEITGYLPVNHTLETMFSHF